LNAVFPEPAGELVCVFCHGGLRVETLSKYDVFLIMCARCGKEMIDCDCDGMNLQPGRGPTGARSSGIHHAR
jgi:hypothetical protein